MMIKKTAGTIKMIIALSLICSTLFIAILSCFWTPYPLSNTEGGRLEAPNASHIAGTDRLGRDSASLIMAGTRIAYTVGFLATLIAAFLGITAGITAAFLPKAIDNAMSSLFDIVIAFPTLLLAMLIGATQGRSTATAIVSIGIACSAIIARLTRILAKQVMSKWFFIAAKTSGLSNISITFRHILPNIAHTLSVNIAVVFGTSILAEASLSYLGLGVPPPNASLGRLMQEAQSTVTVSPYGALIPGAVIIAIVLGVNLAADALRSKK